MKSLILPRAIWNKIFEYDSTYHECYSNLLNEFKEKMTFWRVKWPKDRRISYKYYLQKRKDIYNIVDYWNNDYADYYNFNFTNNKNEKCTDLFITDEECNCHVKVLKHLKDTKGFIWNKEQKTLYKPGKR